MDLFDLFWLNKGCVPQPFQFCLPTRGSHGLQDWRGGDLTIWEICRLDTMAPKQIKADCSWLVTSPWLGCTKFQEAWGLDHGWFLQNVSSHSHGSGNRQVSSRKLVLWHVLWSGVVTCHSTGLIYSTLNIWWGVFKNSFSLLKNWILKNTTFI